MVFHIRNNSVIQRVPAESTELYPRQEQKRYLCHHIETGSRFHKFPIQLLARELSAGKVAESES
jgi:hypothetical protein